MATNFHSDLPNSQIHNPKDYSIANDSSVLTKSHDGGLDWNTSPYGTVTTITCGQDVAGGLHNRSFLAFFTKTAKVQFYFKVAGDARPFTPLAGFVDEPIDINANDSAIAVAAAIKLTAERMTSPFGFKSTVDGQGKVTLEDMNDAPDTLDESTDFLFDNVKTYTGTTVLTSTSGVIEWLPGGSGSGTVTAVTGTAPITSTGGTTPNIGITRASLSADGYLRSVDFAKFNYKQDYVHVPLKGFGVNLAAGEWLQDITDTHPYSFKNRALFGLTDTMRSACYFYKAGQRFAGMYGAISGTVGGRVDVTVYDIRITCDAQHSNNNNAIGTATVTLKGVKEANCFLIGPYASAFAGEGMIVVSVSHTDKDNISFDLQSNLTIQ